MPAFSPDSILSDLSRLLSDFQGREYLDPVTPETRFFADLGLASIDAVVLGEQLQEYYNQPIPFAELMAELGRREDRDLTVGELVNFLERHLG